MRTKLIESNRLRDAVRGRIEAAREETDLVFYWGVDEPPSQLEREAEFRKVFDLAVDAADRELHVFWCRVGAGQDDCSFEFFLQARTEDHAVAVAEEWAYDQEEGTELVGCADPDCSSSADPETLKCFTCGKVGPTNSLPQIQDPGPYSGT
jgi:hypothetical protein